MKNKILILMCMVVFSLSFISSAWSGSGSGTEGDPFQVDNCLRLQEVGSYVTNDYYFIVVNDIDCSDTINWNGGSGFEPIGRQGMGGLQGYFDGQGYTISGLYINRPLEAMTGLFSYSETPYWIRNVGISGATITGGANTGGLVGQLGVDCLVENCYVGGIITGDNAVGGLVGWKDGGNLNYCFSSSSVSGNVGIGGLVGNHQNGAISNSYATGSITGMYDVGGLVGLGAGTFSNCYSTGAVSGSSDVGGLVGRVFGTTCTNSFWDTETSGQVTSACGTGVTTYEMKTQGTYQGWTITASSNNLNDGYPYLVGDEWFIYVDTDTTPPTFTNIPEDVVITYGDLFWGVNFDAIDDDYVYFSINDTENFQIEPNEGQLGDTHTLDVGFYPVNVTITDPTGNLDWTIWSLTVLPLEEPPVQGGGSGLAQTFTSTPTTQTTENAPIFSAIGLNLNISSWNLSEKIQSISISDKITEFFQKIKDWFNIQLNLNWRTQ
jgi:hypothetical protein